MDHPVNEGQNNCDENGNPLSGDGPNGPGTGLKRTVSRYPYPNTNGDG